MTKVRLNDRLIAVTKPLAPEKSIVKGRDFRITVLTDRLFRIEKSRDGRFIDCATQTVWFRNLETPPYKAENTEGTVKISTAAVTLVYDKQSGKSKVIFKDGRTVKCNNSQNLKGTQRTLDGNFGIYRFQNGIMSRSGVAVMRDDGLLLNADGEIVPRNADVSDEYVFAYGNDFRGALKDFYRITGGVPLVPRFALGNWWSRYRAYTQDEYVALMQKFIDKDIPITVATVDMDWHWVNINERFGTDYKGRRFQSPGWTGYSWNTDLFPDHKAFLKWLNERGFKVTLNLHPADGIRHFEDMYEQTAKAVGIDPDSKTDVPFDVTDNRFLNGYFDTVHHPYEDEGVEFWWIDWQQGTRSKMEGLDPLWALNHYFTLDNARKHRPLILSRYAGAGSHRYPLGFSGDTFMRWSSLRRQPYFTNNAANIGYTWWSHDIGGHMLGVRDDELYLRWVQYGVFSPINRLHSSNSDLMGKEPWAYRADVCHFAEEALRFRHKLVPYLYTMNYKTCSEGRALCEPMYYAYPCDEDAYKFGNQYMFGTELMVCPVVKKMNKRTGTASVKAWIPHGRWTDIFTGQVYNGGRVLKLFRGEPSIPVLAREGAIIPLSGDAGNSVKNPENLEFLIYRGNNSFELYEDDGENQNSDISFVKTKFEVSEKEGETITFNVGGAQGDLSLVPENRNYSLSFADITSADVTVFVGDEKIKEEKYSTQPIVVLKNIKCTDKVRVVLKNYTIRTNVPGNEAISGVLSRLKGSNVVKGFLYASVMKKVKNRDYKTAVKRSILPERIKEEIYENMN
ncbi:MAG: glycoside hydrolase family 31 protein [Eubacteriales bacterium]|nr:glycoside hydrolase family 31 protein [Christensenellaceae bacterium]MDY2751149.1 glycoside hydrolase family 31 protein [Eubacteriales bacterium]